MNAVLTKSYLRKSFLQYRKLLDETGYQPRNQQLCDKVQEFIGAKEALKIHTFLAIRGNNEPDISSLFSQLWAAGHCLVVPKSNHENHSMKHYQFSHDTKLEKGKRGILEPVHAEETTTEDIDIIFVPLLIADKLGNRIGYGGGFYDRFLAETNATKVGLSLANPLDKIAQTEKWDVPLDYLITPFKIYHYG